MKPETEKQFANRLRMMNDKSLESSRIMASRNMEFAGIQNNTLLAECQTKLHLIAVESAKRKAKKERLPLCQPTK